MVAARSDAATLLREIDADQPTRRLGRLILTAAIVHLQARLDRALQPSDLIEGLAELNRTDGRPFADSPMPFLQFVDAELAELSLSCRRAAVEVCVLALGCYAPGK